MAATFPSRPLPEVPARAPLAVVVQRMDCSQCFEEDIPIVQLDASGRCFVCRGGSYAHR